MTFHWHQFSSVAQLCLILCDPMNHSTPDLPVHHQLSEFNQTHVHQVGDAIQLSHPLSSPSPPAPNPSQHQSLFQWVNSYAWGGQSTGVSASASVLSMNTQDWSPLGWTGWISFQSKGFSRIFSTPQFKSISYFVNSLLYVQRTWPYIYTHTHTYMTTGKKTQLWLMNPFWQINLSAC